MQPMLKLLMGASLIFSLSACVQQIKAPIPDSPLPVSGDESDPAAGSFRLGEGFRVLNLASGRRMAVDSRKGRRPETWILIHGLADDMKKMEKLSDLAFKSGFSTLRMDLQGHGRTLSENMKADGVPPKTLDYRDNLEDIRDLLLKYRILDAIVVGHSYGGGLAYALAAELKKTGNVRVHSVHMLAPYVQRIDKFLRNQYLNPLNLPHPHSVAIQEANDSILDPILHQFMKKTYRNYIIESDFKDHRGPLTAQQNEEIDTRVEAAILTTKGIRDLDLLDEKSPLPQLGVPLQILGGHKDTLVVPRQLKLFSERLEKEKAPHQLYFLQDGTHLFPRELANETFQLLIEFIEGR